MPTRPARRAIVFLMAAAVAACGEARRNAPPPEPPPEPTKAVALFDFHDGAWVNLHNILYGLGLRAHGHPTRGGGGGHTGFDGLESIDTAALPPSERAAWDAAVAYYAATFAERDATFDDTLADIANQLATREPMPTLGTSSGLPPALATALDGAMAVYRAHWWPQHEASNHAWIDRVMPYVARHGPAIATELSHSYNTAWPTTPVRVEVVHYAYFAGAYTTLGPALITISSTDERNGAPMGLESLFHEASHVVIRPVRDALDHELAAQGKVAGDLWHAVLFFSTGVALQHQLGALPGGYVPYAYKYGLYDGPFRRYRPMLETRWALFLEGGGTFGDAISGLVQALPAKP